MRNDNKEMKDKALIMEVDAPLKEQHAGSQEEAEEEMCVQPSGSRTLDKRLNPEAPDFVPSLETRLLATKIVDELASYTRWSSASDEDISYGPRYDGIWSEISIQEQPPPSEPSNVTELEQLSLKERSRNEGELEPETGTGSAKRGRCWDCKLM